MLLYVLPVRRGAPRPPSKPHVTLLPTEALLSENVPMSDRNRLDQGVLPEVAVSCTGPSHAYIQSGSSTETWCTSVRSSDLSIENGTLSFSYQSTFSGVGFRGSL